MVTVTWNFGFLEIWVAHEFGSVSAGAHRVPTTGRVPALVSNSNDRSNIDYSTVHVLYAMYVVCIYVYMYVLCTA